MKRDFIWALDVSQAAFNNWKSQDQNKKWFKKIDHTPIPNDICVVMAEAFVAALAAASVTGDRETIRDCLSKEFSESYDCTRVWSAWSVGTMGEDDFLPVNDRLDDIVDGLMAVLSKENG